MEEEIPLASLSRRLAAGLIDGVLGFVLMSIAVGIAVPDLADSENLTAAQEESAAVAVIVALSIWVNYLVIGEWRFGRTLGKAWLGICVVGATTREVTWNRALTRNLLRAIDLVAVFFTVPGDPRRRRLGDRAAQTIVIRGNRSDYEPAPVPPTSAPPASTPGTDTGGAFRKPWSAWEPLDAAIGIALVVGGLTIAGSIAAVAADDDPELTLISLFLQGLVFIAAPLLVASWRTNLSPWAVVGFTRFKARDLWLVVGGMVAQVMATLAVAALTMPEQTSIFEDKQLDESTLALALAVVSVVLIAPIAEEALFRGLLFGALRRRLPFIGAAGISGALFGAAHLANGDFAVAGLLAFFGILLAFLYERTGSLGPPIALHMLNNALAMLSI